MAKRFWWPGSMPDQMVLIQNFQFKIGSYETVLGLTPAEVAAAEEMCTAILGAYNLTEQSKASMQAMTQWRDIVFYGEPRGTAVPAAPVFPVAGVNTYKRGSIDEFIALRDRIVAAPGYTLAIGEDLGIIGAEISPIAPEDVQPDLKAVTSNGYWVNLTGSMQGMDAMRVEYAPKGGNFTTVAFLTKTPGGFQITPSNPALPESGHIRAIFIKKNEEFGSYSADYPVILS